MVENPRLAEIIQEHRRRLSFTCSCGECGCPGKSTPSVHDPRVVAATLATVMSELDIDWDPVLTAAASEYGRAATQGTPRASESSRVLLVEPMASAAMG